MRLARDGGEIALYGPGGELLDHLIYGAQATDLAAARTPDGSDEWQILWEASPGESNLDGEGQPGGADPESVPEAGDVSEELLHEDAIVEFDLDLPAASIVSLRSAPRTYVEGSLTYRGRTLSPIGVRLKGQNSFQPIDEKPSFRIELDHYVPGGEIFGLDDLTLNNMSSDPSMMHERFAYKVARLNGVPASRASYAFIRVNGDAYGLYAHIEHVERRMLERWYPDATGSLYEVGDLDFVTADIPLFEHESGVDDRSKLHDLAAALTLPPSEALACGHDGRYGALQEALGCHGGRWAVR